HHRHSIRFLVELAQILDVLRVVDEEIVVANVVAELFLRAGHLRLARPGRLGDRRRGADGDDYRQEREPSAVGIDHKNLMRTDWIGDRSAEWLPAAHI